MDWSALLEGITQGFTQNLKRTRKMGQGLFDKLLGGSRSSTEGYSALRPSDSENMDEPYLAAIGSDYPEGEEAPIPRMPRSRAMQSLGMSDFLEGGGLSTESDLDTLRHKERLLRRLLQRPGGLQYGPMQ